MQVKYVLQAAERKGEEMRNRQKQRELRKAGIRKEEKIEMRDFCGIRDPTPYQAVKNIMYKQLSSYFQEASL